MILVMLEGGTERRRGRVRGVGVTFGWWETERSSKGRWRIEAEMVLEYSRMDG